MLDAVRGSMGGGNITVHDDGRSDSFVPLTSADHHEQQSSSEYEPSNSTNNINNLSSPSSQKYSQQPATIPGPRLSTMVPGESAAYTLNTGSDRFTDYPMSARERQQLDEEWKAQQISAAALASSSSSSSAAQQQQMLSDQLHDPSSQIDGGASHPSSASSSGHSSLELEDEYEAYQHPFPLRSALIAVFLLAVGLTCLCLGIYHFTTGKDSSFAFIIIGSILIIPGGYQCYIIYNAWRRRPGFSFSQLAAYEQQR